MDGSSLPAAGTLGGSIILFASRTVPSSFGSSTWQLDLSATTLTSRHHNRHGPSLPESSGQGLNRHGHVRVVTSQYPGSFADRYEHSSARPMDWRDRLDHGCLSSGSYFWGIRLRGRYNVWCDCVHGYLPLVLVSSDPGAHRAQITNRRFTSSSHSSLRRFDFTPLRHDQL